MFDEPDALSLEYKRDYGIARRNVNIADIVNNPNASGVVRVFGPGFSEKITDLRLVEVSAVPDDRPDSDVISCNRI